MSAGSPPTLCLGDGVVELVGERPGAEPADVDRFSPHFGGAAVAVAIVAARAGAPVALAGVAGDDAWGQALRERLVEARVDVSRFALAPAAETPLAFVTVDGDGARRVHPRGGPEARLASMAPGELEAAAGEAAALFVSTETLERSADRELTMRARELTLAQDKPVVFDANLRPERWGSRADAAASANACVRGALLVRAGAAEAALMTGENDAERAATALVKAGARLVVLTLGSQGAILRGALRATAPGVPGRPLDPGGAGEALTGTLLARLALSGFYDSSVAAALPEALAAAAGASERWGTVD